MQKHVLILLAAFGLMFVSCIAQSVSRNCDLSPLEFRRYYNFIGFRSRL